MMNDLFLKKVTIYNDVPETDFSERKFDRHVIDKCNIQEGRVSKADGTIENIVNAITVITKSTDRHKKPNDYLEIPSDIANGYFTVQIGDFVVLSEVDDVVTTARDFSRLQSKYANNGFVVRTVSTYLNGMDVDNVQFANVG